MGGVVGGLLHRAGNDVVLIARGAHLAAIQRGGLRLETPSGASVERVRAVATPADLEWRPGDVVLLAVKSDATVAALSALALIAPATTPLVCVQNGVANEPTALRWFEQVYGVCVMAPTVHLEPGVVGAHSAPTAAILDIGHYPDGLDETARSVASAFSDAEMTSQPRADIMRWKYRKLLMNLGNAVHAVCNRSDGFEELRDLIRLEGETALTAAGIEPVSEDDDNERRGDILEVKPIAGSPRTGGSTWQSLERRTGAIETDYLNGEIVWLGRRYGVATPANELIRRVANRCAAERTGPGRVDPASLLAELDIA